MVVLSPLFLLMSYNIVVDHRGFVNERYVNSIAESLQNEDISIFDDIPERKVVLKRIAQSKGKHFNKVVLGSSRIMLFGKPIDENVFNIAVSGAGIEDCIALVDKLKKNGISYDTLVLCADPWLLNKNHGDEQYKVFYGDDNSKDIESIISWNYFLENLQSKSFKKWDGNENDFVRFKDGSIRYNKEHRENNLDVTGYAKRDTIYHLGGFENIDSNYKKTFIDFILDQAKDATVELILIPYHPLNYKRIIERVPTVVEAEKTFTSLNSSKVRVLGSYSPFKLSLERTGFYDASHIKEDVLKRIYKMM